MKFLNNMKIGLRLNLILSVVMVVIISSIGIYTIRLQKTKIIADTDLRMNEQVTDLSNLIQFDIARSQENVKRALLVAQTVLNRDGGVQYDGKGYTIKGKQVTENFDFVDEVTRITGASVSLFLKENGSFVRVSTTVKNISGARETGTKIDSNSEILKAVENGQEYSGRAVVVDSWYLTSYSPIKKDGEVIGIIGVGVPEKNLASLKSIFNSKKYFLSGYPFVVDKEGTFLIHPTSEGKNFANAEFFLQLKSAGTEAGKTRYIWEGKTKYQYFKYLPAIESYVSVSIYEVELFDIISSVRNTILISILLGMGIFVLIITQISKAIASGLQKGVNLAKMIAEGNLNATIELDQKDEVGELVKSLNFMVLKLREIVKDIINGANNIASASQQISSTSQQISQGASEQASSVEELSSTMEEMVGNINQNSDNARETESISRSALKGIEDVAGRSSEAVEATRTISGKIVIINDIAFQTNILALNAAVEAARAGEHGRGFAVVAAEVRKLAEKSKVAADEIVGIARKSVELVEGAGNKLNEMIPEVSKTSKLVQEIAASSQEQNNGSNQVNSAIQQLNSVTQENAAASEELATSAEELASQAEQLKEMIQYFKVDELEVAREKTWKHYATERSERLERIEQDDTIGINPRVVLPKKPKTLKKPDLPEPQYRRVSTSGNKKGVNIQLESADDAYEKF